MTAFSWILVGVSSMLAVIDWWAVQTGNERVEQFAKPGVMLALIGSAFASDLEGWPLGWLVAALAFGVLGDVLLLPRVDRFVPGLAAFLLGHLAYASLAVDFGLASGWLIGGLVVASGLVFTYGSKIADAAHGSPQFGPVALYIVVLALSTSVLIGTGLWVLVLGALLFALSDSLLGWDRFIDDAPGGRVAVHATYHLAQIALVVGTAVHAA